MIVAGKGPLTLLAREYAAKSTLAGRIDVLGEVVHDRALELIATSDILVLPSHGEGSPLSVTEALALGTPVIATRVGGVPDLVGDDGILIDSGDVDALTAAMRELAEDTALRARLGVRARARVERTRTWPAISYSTVDLYRVAIEAYAKRRA